MVRQRSVAMVIILSLLTCGIYTIIWYYQVSEDLRYLTGDNSMSGGKTILLIFITCGIYTLFWYYIVGQKIAEIHRMKNMLVKDNGLLYIVLSIFSLVLWQMQLFNMMSIKSFNSKNNTRMATG